MNTVMRQSQNKGQLPLESGAPELHLDGSILAQALEAATVGAEALGGIERYVNAVSLKANLFQDALADGKVKTLELDALMGLCTFMPSVRRRIAPYLDAAGLGKIRQGLVMLLNDKTNTGALREMWFGDDVDHMIIDVPDGYATFLVLRQELSQFLTSNGVYRDVLYYVDVLCAQIYSQYICSQGGSYLRADFSSPQDPMQYTRRLLGLDGVEPRSGKTRLKSIDGTAFVLDDVKLLG